MRGVLGILTAFVLLAFAQCKRSEEPLRWNADYTVPLIHGSLGIADLLPDSLIGVDTDSSVMLVYEGNLLNLNLDEILVLPDTIIADTFQVPFPTPVNISPGQVFINIPEEESLALQGISLSSAKIAAGKVDYVLESTVQGEVIYQYEISSATDWMGNTFLKTITVPAASPGATSSVSGTFSLDGYYLDMTGQAGVDFNRVLTNINCKISDDNGSDVSVSSADVITISNAFRDIVVEEAEGYFGQHTVTTGLEYATFEGFEKWISGSIDIENVEVDLVLKNGVGIDAFLQLNQLVADSETATVSLVHAMLGELIALTRPTRYYDSIVPSTYSTHLDESNSNIDNFLEALPTQIGYDVEVEVNPLGNISGYNDFYDASAPIGVYLNASIPLSFIANDLTLEDTLVVTFDETTPVNDLVLLLEVANGFPLEANVEIGVLDINDKVISRVFAPNIIEAASLGTDGKVSESTASLHEITIDGIDLERIKTNQRILLTVVLNTPGTDHVKIYNDYIIDYKIKADANITLSTGNE
jgi:hypothetical protein